MKTEEGNRLIAEFMGHEIIAGDLNEQCEKHHYNMADGHCTCGRSYDRVKGLGYVKDLKYHKDWNMLVPVMIKLGKVLDTTDITKVWKSIVSIIQRDKQNILQKHDL